jgi:hypothetical protein
MTAEHLESGALLNQFSVQHNTTPHALLLCHPQAREGKFDPLSKHDNSDPLLFNKNDYSGRYYF